MKKFILFVIAALFALSVSAQYKSIKKNRDIMRTATARAIDTPIPGEKPANLYVGNHPNLVDQQVMMTNYDLMTNGATGQSRLVYFPDGSMAASATWSQDPGGTLPGRATGFNYSTNFST